MGQALPGLPRASRAHQKETPTIQMPSHASLRNQLPWCSVYVERAELVHPKLEKFALRATRIARPGRGHA